MIGQETLSSLDPPSRGCQEPCVQEQGGHLLRRPGPPFVFASTHGRRVNALPGVDGLLRMARQVRGIREGRKGIQVESAGVIGLREERVGLVPGLPIHGLTRLIEDRVIRRLVHVPPPVPGDILAVPPRPLHARRSWRTIGAVRIGAALVFVITHP